MFGNYGNDDGTMVIRHAGKRLSRLHLRPHPHHHVSSFSHSHHPEKEQDD